MQDLLIERRWSWVVIELGGIVVISTIGVCGLGSRVFWPEAVGEAPLAPGWQGMLSVIAFLFLPLGGSFGWRILRPMRTRFTTVGIQQPGLRRRQTIRWDDVQEAELGPDQLILRAPQGLVKLPFRCVKEPNAVLALIEAHLPPSVYVQQG